MAKKNLEILLNLPLAKTFFALEGSLSIKRFWGKKGDATLALTPAPLPHLKSPLPYVLGRSDTQAIGKRQLKSSREIPISIVVDPIFLWASIYSDTVSRSSSNFL